MPNNQYIQYEPLVRQIRASAGSGKTYELTSSFLSYLTHATDQPSILGCQNKHGLHSWLGILAITFTNRAATEMQQRIIHHLKETALGNNTVNSEWTPQQACQWLTTILRNYGELNIRTIDSLLHTIVRLTALELELSPNFQPTFSNEETLAPLLDTILENTKHDPALYAILYEACQDIFFHTPSYGFILGTTLRKNVLSAVLPFLAISREVAQPADIAERLQKDIQHVKHIAKSLFICLREEQLSLNTKFRNALELCQSDTNKTFPPNSTLLRKASLQECILKSSKNQPSHKASELYNTLQKSITRLDTKGKILQQALTITPYIRLAKEIHKLLPEFFRKRDLILATLIPSLAKQALSGAYGVSGAFCKLGTNLTHILIDEFQDTSHEQWEAIQPLIIEALSHGGSLTWVGDVKQAIYSWRGGDAALFDNILQNDELRSIVSIVQKDMLSTNWRSAQTIVSTNNSIFSKLAEHDIAEHVLSNMCYANTPIDIKTMLLKEHVPLITQSFSDVQQSLPDEKPTGYVHIQKIPHQPELELNSMVQDHLITILKDIQSRRPLGDVAILVRSNSKAKEIAHWLLDAAIPVVTENSFLLSEHPLITQLVALLKFLDSPQNELAFWTLLSGGTLLQPLLMISQQHLDEWICTRQRSQPLYLAFKCAFPELWDRWFAPFYADAGILSPYDAIQEAMNRFTIAQRFQSEMPFVRSFLEVIYAASTKGYCSISTFLEHWEQHGNEEKTPMPENLNAVRIITIHKSKGLQFPVVIIPYHDFSPHPDDKKLIQTSVDDLTLIVKLSPAVPNEYYSSLMKNSRESLHLLYVAWTRAEEELYAIVTKDSSRGTTFSEAITPLLDHLTWENDTYIVGEKPQYNSPTSYRNTDLLSDITVEDTITLSKKIFQKEEDNNDENSWRPMHWLPQLRIFRSPLQEFTFTNKRRGILLHYCLQYLRITGNPLFDASQAVSHGIKRFPLPILQHDDIEKEFINSITWYASLPETAYWIHFGIAEQSILDSDNKIYRPDLIVNDGNICSIVEYKTGVPSLLHEKQIQNYIHLIQQSMKGPVTGYLVYFDYKKIQPIRSN